MKLLTTFGGFAASAAILAGTALGNVIHVPADYPTINQAIAAAVDGDSILVDPGTYVEMVDFLGKAITVSATDPDPTVTLIVAPASAPAAKFQTGETSAAQLEGFTLTGGSGVLIGGKLVGGNLLVDGASPTLKNLIVRDNLGVSSGGGAWFSNSSSLLDGVVFLRGTAGDSGGGLFAINSSLVIDTCRFEDCYAISEGAGLYADSCPSLTMRDSDVLGNQASFAGGAEASQTTLDLSGCQIDGNLSDEGPAGGMGVISCNGVVAACAFTNNWASQLFGGGIYIYGDTPITIQDCDFQANYASQAGGDVGVQNSPGSSGPTITGCRSSESHHAVYVDGDALFEHDDFTGGSKYGSGTGIYVDGPGAARFVDVSID